MTTTQALSHAYRFVPGTDPTASPLLLLHGTGGDENDLVPLGKTIAPGAALLSPRGNVSEGGHPRFFRRFAEGVFDEDDVRRRAEELADFVADAREAFNLAPPIAVGFSNGANVAAAVLMLRPQTFAGAILLRAMVPLRKRPDVDLAAEPVLLLSGAVDPIVPASNAAELAAILQKAGAAVEHQILPTGHGLTQADIRIAKTWLAQHTV